jgi:hypothetical protein
VGREAVGGQALYLMDRVDCRGTRKGIERDARYEEGGTEPRCKEEPECCVQLVHGGVGREDARPGDQNRGVREPEGAEQRERYVPHPSQLVSRFTEQGKQTGRAKSIAGGELHRICIRRMAC